MLRSRIDECAEHAGAYHRVVASRLAVVLVCIQSHLKRQKLRGTRSDMDTKDPLPHHMMDDLYNL